MSAIVLTLIAIPAAQASSSGRAVSGAVPQSAEPGTYPQRGSTGTAVRSEVVTQRLRHGIRERRRAAWTHQDWLGFERAKTAYRERQTRSTPYLRWLKSRWAHRAHRLWTLRAHTLRDFEVRPGSSAWLKAVEEAQRPYPNTAWWLKSCSSTEGGWGRWVPNNQGAPPGGWMQMYESTFWRMWSTAKADVERRGYRVPSSAASWYSPLGQALASAWGLTNGRRHEWDSSGC